MCFYNLQLQSPIVAHISSSLHGKEWCPKDLSYFPFYLSTHLFSAPERGIYLPNALVQDSLVTWTLIIDVSIVPHITRTVLVTNSSCVPLNCSLTSSLCCLLWAWLYSHPPRGPYVHLMILLLVPMSPCTIIFPAFSCKTLFQAIILREVYCRGEAHLLLFQIGLDLGIDSILYELNTLQ